MAEGPAERSTNAHEDLRMVAANGTEIKNEGQKIIKFRGVGAEAQGAASPTFGRPK